MTEKCITKWKQQETKELVSFQEEKEKRQKQKDKTAANFSFYTYQKRVSFCMSK